MCRYKPTFSMTSLSKAKHVSVTHDESVLEAIYEPVVEHLLEMGQGQGSSDEDVNDDHHENEVDNND